MKQHTIFLQPVIAPAFSALLIAAYLFTRDTVVPIISYKIIWPMHIVPDHYTPWIEVANGISHTSALILPSLFCGAVFGHVFRSRTALWAMLPAAGLAVSLLLSLRGHRFHWTVYYSHAFLAVSFIVFSTLAARLYRTRFTDSEKAGGKQRAIPALVLFAAIAGASWLHFHYPLLGTRVSGVRFEGIVLSKQIAENMGYPDPSGWWDVRDSDIRTLEDRLENYVRAHPYAFGPHLRNELAAYRRWYHAQSSKTGDKQIHVFLMHGSHVSRPKWLHVLFGVAGGGDYYCNVTYGVKDGSFENARCNADA